MKVTHLLLSLFASCVAATPAQDYPIQPVPFTNVRITDDFWRPRMDTNAAVTVPVCFKRCDETGRIDNFAKAGKLIPGEFRGIRYDDSDVFKVIEGAAYTLALKPDPALEKYLDDLISKIAAAQESDGYLYTCRTINPARLPRDTGQERWAFIQHSHELYNVGHMYEAGAAHFQATGKRSLLSVALKNADLIDRTFGPGKRYDVPGHEEIEIGLVKLYRITGEPKYLKLAKFFIDQRGWSEHRKLYGEYAQDHKPVIEQIEPIGHSVRAGYLYTGMADVAAITGEKSYLRALEMIWTNLVSKKIYLTGGMGAEAGHEGFGPDYFLPNGTAYNETCAAVALALWNQRMFLLTGEAKYMDLVERVIYNGFLSGISLGGDTFFYPNPLACDGKGTFNHGSLERSPWFGTACCPVNVVRFLPSIAGYVYAQRQNDPYVNLFVAGEAKLTINGQQVTLRQKTQYPWDGLVEIVVDTPKPQDFTLRVRLPGWTGESPMPGNLYRFETPSSVAARLRPPSSGNAKIALQVNGRNLPQQVENGYAAIKRKWKAGDRVTLKLPMDVKRVVADQRVEADRGRVALERGPLVYCFEGVDNGGSLGNVAIAADAKITAQHKPDLLGGITVLRVNGKSGLRAIPYYAWDHRGAGEMAVWVPRAP